MTPEQFDVIAARTPYQRKGMFYSEVFFFLRVCARHQVVMVVESGVKYGMSTRLLGAAGLETVIAVERMPQVRVIDGVQLIEGDSLILLPQLVKQAAARNVGVLIDGPKGATARQLKDRCLVEGAKVVGIHDEDAGHGESAHTHTASDFRSIANVLDRFVSDEYRRKYPHGSGLAIWEQR